MAKMQKCGLTKIDVVVLTYNSQRVLEKCLESIYKNLSVNQLIAVDGYSTDRTLSILQKFQCRCGNVKIIQDKGTRATARQKGIDSVQTDWFMFVDSDVILCKDWQKKAERYLENDVGAVWGIEVWSTVQTRRTLKMFLWMTRKIFDLRGGTHDTLIRTKALAGIRIPPNLHVFEDAYIRDWIIQRGCRVVAAYSPYCIHYRSPDVWTFKGSLNIIVDAFRFGGFKLIGKLILAYGFYAAYSGYQLISNRIHK